MTENERLRAALQEVTAALCRYTTGDDCGCVDEQIWMPDGTNYTTSINRVPCPHCQAQAALALCPECGYDRRMFHCASEEGDFETDCPACIQYLEDLGDKFCDA